MCARTLVTAAIAFVLASGFGPAPAAASVGVQGGIQGAGLTYRPNVDFFDHGLKFRPSWSAGIQWVVPVASLDLETGVRYVEYGDEVGLRFEGTGSSFRIDAHQVWRYVAVPALVRARPFATRRLFVGLGPEAAYLLALWDDVTTSSVTAGAPSMLARKSANRSAGPAAQIFEDIGTYPGDNYRRWNLSACGAIGIEFALGRHIGEAQVRYTHGLVDIAKSSALARETRGVELLASLRW